ncbi:MAG: serine/threonine-protein kinase, partial [Planctomycetota bacterium]|nr:serine/threonine-protein kinase [Planctomycetota bacterium]
LPEPGEWIGSYQIQRLLGKGGMGAVYAARRGERDYALKMILALENPADEIRFEREAQAAAAVDRHPNVVSVHSYDRHGNTPYAVFDLIEGVGLDELLTTGEAQELDWTLNIVIKSLRALVHIHEAGVIHRDLKPANILIRHSDGEPLITDFGLAKQEDAEKLTRTGEMLGTPAYMAAEQMSGEKVTEAADVWAMGVILYELLTGYRPFPGATLLEICNKVLLQDPISPKKHVPELDDELQTVILKCLQRDLENRYESARELLEDLVRYQKGEAVEAVLPSFDVVGASKKFWWAGVAFVLAICFLGAGFIYVKSIGDEISNLENKLPEKGTLNEAVATRLVHVAKGDMSLKAVDEIVQTRRHIPTLFQLEEATDRDLSELKSLDRILRLKLLIDLVKIRSTSPEKLIVTTTAYLENETGISKFNGAAMKNVRTLYLALHSKESLNSGEAFALFEKLPLRLQKITLSLLEGVIAKEMVTTNQALVSANYRRLVELHERLEVEDWTIFSKTLRVELEALRLRSQKPNSEKLFSQVFSMFLVLFQGDARKGLSVFKESAELVRYKESLSKKRCLIALEAAYELKKLGFWNEVPDKKLQVQLNTFFVSNAASEYNGQSRMYHVVKAIEVGCLIENYRYFLRELKETLSDDLHLKSLIKQARGSGEEPWYFQLGRRAYRSRGARETQEAWAADCRLTVTLSKSRLNILKRAERDPTHSSAVRTEIQGLIAEGYFDLANYEAMVATLVTQPLVSAPSAAELARCIKLYIQDIGHYLSNIQLHPGLQTSRVCEIKKWLIDQGLDYETLAPVLNPKVRAIFKEHSLEIGVAKLADLCFPGAKQDVEVDLTLQQRRLVLLKA